jgi:hypothetical protein
MNIATTAETTETTPASAPKRASRKSAPSLPSALVAKAAVSKTALKTELTTGSKTTRGAKSRTSLGTKPAASRKADQNINSALLLHEDDLKAITGQVLSAVMEKIIPLLEKIELINKNADTPAVANVVEMSTEQTAAKQLQQQLQTMAQMKLKSLEDRVTHRIQQMQGK